MSLAIRTSDSALLRRLLDAGLSPNPCNNFGESLVHLVCRRGDHNLLRVLLQNECSLQVTDDFGRTPFHDACWGENPNFDLVQLILASDRDLINLEDTRGATPLCYIKPENYKKWVDFLETKMDRYFPYRQVMQEGEERPPALALRLPHSVPILDPLHSLPLVVAALVANGEMQPEDAVQDSDSMDDSSCYSSDDYDSSDDDSAMDSDQDDDEEDESFVEMKQPKLGGKVDSAVFRLLESDLRADHSEDDYDFSSDDGFSDDSEYDSDFDDDVDDEEYDQKEMAEFCSRAGGPMAVARKCFTGLS
jgi:ankyrin repeat protein